MFNSLYYKQKNKYWNLNIFKKNFDLLEFCLCFSNENDLNFVLVCSYKLYISYSSLV